MKRGRRPQRSCLGCGARDDQKALLRFVVRGSGELALNRFGKGRGGYLHKAEKCWEAFLRRKSLYRAFHLEIGRQVRERLLTALRKEKLGIEDGKDKGSFTSQGSGIRD